MVETQYCITLDRIPEELYPEIATNHAQREEWVRLLSINLIEGYSEPLTEEFLKENNGLVIAEIELQKESQSFPLPDWVGKEVTGIKKYYNARLTMVPYSAWKKPKDK